MSRRFYNNLLRNQNTTDEYDITDKIHTGPFHDESHLDYKLSFDKKRREPPMPSCLLLESII